MQTINTTSEEVSEYSVLYWRNRFAELKGNPNLKRNWFQQLVNFDARFDSLKGSNQMRAVSHNRASLLVTQQVVSAIEQMLKKQPARSRPQKSVRERLRLG